MSTNDLNLNFALTELSMNCYSDRAENGENGAPLVAVDNFSILYKSSCYTSPIEASFKSSYSVDLYGVRTNTIDFLGTAESNCVPVYYELLKDSTTA